MTPTRRVSHENEILRMAIVEQVVRKTDPKRISKISKKVDSETLLQLDTFYTELYGLILLEDPDPDYFAVNNRNKQKALIKKSIKQLPDDMQSLLQFQFEQINELLDEKKYQTARHLVHEWGQPVIDLLSDGREPPEYIKKIWSELPEVDI